MHHRSHLFRGTRQPPYGAVAVAILLLGLGLLVVAGPVAQAEPGPEPALAPPPPAYTVVSDAIYLPFLSGCRPRSIAIAGPDSGTIGLSYHFTAQVVPGDVSLPVTYTWKATGQVPIVHVGGTEDSADFVWDLTGPKVVTVEIAIAQCRTMGSAAVEMTTRGLIAFERHYAEADPHDIWLIHNVHTDLEINLTDSPDTDEGAPTWSPDGNWLAYSADAPTGPNRAIYKMSLSTGQVILLTDGSTNDRWPTWSPDGTQIAFMREAGLPPDIYVMNADGSNQHQLTDWLYGDDYPSWSPDGRRIAFVSDRDYAGRDLYVMDADGSSERRLMLTPEEDELYPTWSPDGLIYYTHKFAQNNEILYRIDPDGGEPTDVFGDGHSRWIASFSPDGQCFSFYSRMSSNTDEDKEVWKWCQGYAGPVNLTNNDAGDEYSAWSPVP